MTWYLNGSVTIATDDAENTLEDWEFLRIQGEKPGDVPEEYEEELTRGEVVDIFASIFGRGSCYQPDAPDAYEGPEDGETPQESTTNYLLEKYPGRDGAQQLAAEFGTGGLCLPETIDGGEIEEPVYVHASSEYVFDNYNIVAPGSKLSKVQYRAHDIYLKIEFSNVSYASIYYFVDTGKLSKYLSNKSRYGDIYEWRGIVKDQSGETVEKPTWTISNGRVYFPGNWSGILILKRLPIEYHYYNVIIQGTVDADATRHYVALISGKAPGLSIVQLEIEEEEKAEETKKKCPWLDFDYGLNATGTATEVTCGNCGEQEPEKEPEQDEGPEPDESTCEPITDEEYLSECCAGTDVTCKPVCREITTPVRGPIKGDPPSAYSGKTEIIVLMPDDNTPCGELTTTWTTSGGCDDECEGVEDLSWNPDNPDVIAAGSSANVGFLGGLTSKPKEYTLGGGEFYFENGTQSITSSGVGITVYAAGDACGSATISADDGCSSASGTLRCDQGRWLVIFNEMTDGGLNVSCIVGKYKYMDDRCTVGNCSNTDYKPRCPSPDPADIPEGSVLEEAGEGAAKFEWSC